MPPTPDMARRARWAAGLLVALSLLPGCQRARDDIIPEVPADAIQQDAHRLAVGAVYGALRPDGWTFSQWFLARLQKDCPEVAPDITPGIMKTSARTVYAHRYVVDLVLVGPVPDCAHQPRGGWEFAEVWVTPDGVSVRPSSELPFGTASDWFAEFQAGDAP